MKQSIFTIVSNNALTDVVYKMVLEGDTSAITAPGQFVNIKLEGFFLRRPISVNDVEGDILTLIYKPLGEGTRQMTTFQPGKVLDILTGLGNGFDPALSGEKPLLVGGGVGIPPLYNLCKRLIAKGAKPVVVLGFNIEATVGTAMFLKANGIRTHALTKISDGSEEIPNALRQGHIAYVINTKDPSANEADGHQIRQISSENNVTLFTSLDTVSVLLDVLEETTLTISTIDA